MMNKNLITTLLALAPLMASAQNITDLAVANDKSADSFVYIDDNRSTVAEDAFLAPDRIRYDNRCLQIEGKDEYVLSGAFHYFRVPKPLWRDRMMKLKQIGFNCVETYIPWNWHERTEPASVDDFSKLDMTDLEEFLRLAEEVGLYVIARPGPYICAEWSGGGFPQWIMNKKPAKTLHDTWLQSNDEEFVRWNRHWYTAVCRTVRPHLITQRQKGQKGVILFQIENEFNRIKWFPSEEKRSYLENLATIVRQCGIDVPIITCWTSEARNVEQGPLRGVVDMVNSYPRWQIDRNFGRLINQQLKSQPGKPLISGELQGGWLSELSTSLSWNQDGLEPVQTQNITLYALQRGFSALSFYMTVGGTNHDDWGARNMTQTYDFAAAISEDGNVNERGRRFAGLAQLLKEHGTKIARARLTAVDYTSTDPDVLLALRRADNGDRYYFVRTEDHSRSHHGSIQTDGLTLNFALEPFGSMVYYVSADGTTTQWMPQMPEPQQRPYVAPTQVALQHVAEFADAQPTRWTKLGPGQYVDQQGVNGRHLIYYRTQALSGDTLEIGRVGNKVINGTPADTMLVSVDGRLLPIVKETATAAYYVLLAQKKQAKKEVVMLFESKGLHHHTRLEVEQHWHIGPDYVRSGGRDLPLSYAYTEAQTGKTLSTQGVKKAAKANNSKAESMLRWSVYEFATPQWPEGVSVPLQLTLKQKGNGYLYFNGHCLGRIWQYGPQQTYWLPECWLRKDGKNTIAISLRPSPTEARVEEIGIVAETWKAEKRK